MAEIKGTTLQFLGKVGQYNRCTSLTKDTCSMIIGTLSFLAKLGRVFCQAKLLRPMAGQLSDSGLTSLPIMGYFCRPLYYKLASALSTFFIAIFAGGG